jgi:eukaryotic translation initiation factor 2C
MPYGYVNEEIMDLAFMVQERLMTYEKRRNKFPRKLIFYRDGLSEAQLDMCLANELPRIRQGITNAKKGRTHVADPQLMLICTIKRHHTRFFQDPATTRGKGRPDPDLFFDSGNPLPGCMVSGDVTFGENRDFFLISHEAIKGTARPTHYVVLVNDSNERLNDIAAMVS